MAVLGCLLAATHALLIGAVAVGTVCSISGYLSKHRRLENGYLVLILAVIISQIMYGECVLTRWEKAARNRYTPGTAYRESFLAHYVPFFPHLFYAWAGPIFVLCGLLCVIVRRVRRRAK